MDETRMQGKTQNEKIKLLSVTLNTNLRPNGKKNETGQYNNNNRAIGLYYTLRNEFK